MILLVYIFSAVAIIANWSDLSAPFLILFGLIWWQQYVSGQNVRRSMYDALRRNRALNVEDEMEGQLVMMRAKQDGKLRISIMVSIISTIALVAMSMFAFFR